jgi:two-component system nitrogen regulation response regulator NtrX
VLIEGGTFRHDLFYRLNVIPFQIPPLRDRVQDIPLLVDHFNRRFSASYKREPKQFTDDAVDLLRDHSWPGNVRELKNTIERVIIMTSKQKVRSSDLPPLGAENGIPAATFRFPTFKDATDAYQREFIQHKLAEFDGSVTKAAESMGVDRSHLYRRMRHLGIQGK